MSTLRVAEMPEPTREDFELRDALRGNQTDTDLFFGIGDGTVSPSEFFAPKNLARILRVDS